MVNHGVEQKAGKLRIPLNTHHSKIAFKGERTVQELLYFPSPGTLQALPIAILLILCSLLTPDGAAR